MVYRITVRSNPRILLIIAIIVLLPGAGIASFLFMHPVLSVLLTAVGGLFAYHLVKYLVNTLKSRVQTGEDGILFEFGGKDRTSFAWNEIDFAGFCRQAKNRPFLYLYQEKGDRLITVPNEYTDFDRLVEEVRARLEFEEVSIGETETIADILRARLSPAPTEGAGDGGEQ